MNKDYYKILGVSKDASSKEIKERYQKLKTKFESDPNPSKQKATRFKHVKEAYRVLSKKETREEYDKEYVQNEAVLVKEKKVEEQKEEAVEPELKAYFVPRVIAYLLDIMLISLVASFIFMIFPQSENVAKLTEQQEKVMEQFVNQEIDSEQYLAQTMDLSYDMAYQNVIYVIIEVTLALGYFVVFQYKTGGKTLGKWLMHIKVVSADGKELTLNNYLYRALLLQAILLNIILVIAVLLLSKSYYGSFELCFESVQSILMLATLGMILFRKDGRGVHDFLGNTKVVMDGSKERKLCVN